MISRFFYYKVIHRFRSHNHNKITEIGVFSSMAKALAAIDAVKGKNGFVDYPDGFTVKKIFRRFKPDCLDIVFWNDGFDTYYFARTSNELCCDEQVHLMKHLSFLLSEYNFKFDKYNLGDLVNENGKIWYYGPYNCYYFYNGNLCISILNLTQRQDWNIYINTEVLSDQNLIKKGKELPAELCYNLPLLAKVIKEELAASRSIFGISID